MYAYIKLSLIWKSEMIQIYQSQEYLISIKKHVVSTLHETNPPNSRYSITSSSSFEPQTLDTTCNYYEIIMRNCSQSTVRIIVLWLPNIRAKCQEQYSAL